MKSKCTIFILLVHIVSLKVNNYSMHVNPLFEQICLITPASERPEDYLLTVIVFCMSV